MDDEKLKALRALGVKCATFLNGEVASVEFFPTISPLDFDTLVPPPPADMEDASAGYKAPPALARLVKRSSVS